MEPRPHERGKNTFGRRLQCCESGFNGATSSRTWKGQLMPPSKPHFVTGLQWSHVLTNVESSLNSRRAFATSPASMEPRPHERGKSAQSTTLAPLQSGFNGATSSRTWKVEAVTIQENRRRRLQWSHVLTNVESCNEQTVAGWYRGLQWSHVLTNVERFIWCPGVGMVC